MIRKVLNLVILALVVHAAWRVVPVYWQYMKFKEAVAETARFAGTRTEEEIRQRVITLAERYEIPIAADAVVVRRDAEQVVIEANYTVALQVLPRYSRPWAFNVKAEAWTLKTDSFPK
jgi:hypothetical protein